MHHIEHRADYFLVEITDVVSSGEYAFQELWLDTTGLCQQKTGGRYGDADTPGIPPTGTTFTTGDVRLCRVGSGDAGPTWELLPLGGSSPNPVYGDVIGPDHAQTGQLAQFTDPSGRFIGPVPRPPVVKTLGATHILSADSTWEDVGLQITLPGPGYYFLYGHIYGRLVTNGTFGPSFPTWLVYRWVDGAGFTVFDGQAVVSTMLGLDLYGHDTFNYVWKAPFAQFGGSRTLKLQALYDPNGVGTIATAQIVRNATGAEIGSRHAQTHIGWARF